LEVVRALGAASSLAGRLHRREQERDEDCDDSDDDQKLDKGESLMPCSHGYSCSGKMVADERETASNEAKFAPARGSARSLRSTRTGPGLISDFHRGRHFFPSGATVVSAGAFGATGRFICCDFERP